MYYGSVPSKKGRAHLRDQQKMNNKDNKASTKKQQNKCPNPEHFGDVWGYISTTTMSTKTRPLNLHPRKLTAGTKKKLVVGCFSKFSFWWYFQVPAGSFLGCMRIWNKMPNREDQCMDIFMVYVPST